MSAFGMGGGGGYRGGGEHPQVKAAKLEMEGVTDMFNRMSDLCFKNCMGKFAESDLNVGEMSCTDRCVSKYMAAHRKVGEKFQEFQLAEQQRIQATQGMAPQ
mmetsp:Transcript_27804/g.44521  ORF Transcript_27804/g.44521 Transcript_27804/m.44521 type:complete len:102 (+) Transcript_27804:154-459(+)|eukprot:CAMPEP_0203763398 /NCGR_PEP_ID=MMETSP0098-20131031/16111_1 /ASSEMBLY_ACC=CAM_ASM_000208 /TAXON_ID=96639 /ORGANISM=" , Strain NY0313808BC1" /LENGTH=101 /DNA_ID=CAMNT_0050658181 /DNA_START=109 /DNA_END=414 /DNA_ORIENTATION=-